MIYVRNDDKPGFIGEVGRLLGEAKVNIANFHLGRMSEGGEAVCLISVDGVVSDETVAAIEAIDQVKIVDRVSL
jgi:D-3-phosphoglycerate dehydrogenase